MTLAAIAGLSLALVGGGMTPGQMSELTGQDLEDVQCFALFAVVAGESGVGPDVMASADAEQATVIAAMTGGMMYHLGRLEGRTPQVDWLDRIAEYGRSVDIADLRPAGERCLQSLSDKGQALVDWGQRVQQE